MAEYSTLVRPYARAVFEFGVQGNNLDSWSEQLAVAAAVSREKAIDTMLTTPSYTAAQQAEMFIEVCGDALDEFGKNFISVLAQNKRLTLLPSIAELFETFKANRERRVDVEVSTAYELNQDLQDKLRSALSSKLGRDVALKVESDRDLLGGVVVRAADVVIDASVRKRLADLAKAMNI